jgi:hypothetical protein
MKKNTNVQTILCCMRRALALASAKTLALPPSFCTGDRAILCSLPNRTNIQYAFQKYVRGGSLTLCCRAILPLSHPPAA